VLFLFILKHRSYNVNNHSAREDWRFQHVGLKMKTTYSDVKR